jgi:hypothetical protein
VVVGTRKESEGSGFLYAGERVGISSVKVVHHRKSHSFLGHIVPKLGSTSPFPYKL